ncbi:tyrosine-type recombinase/integrase, partial [Clostridium felsineum]|uniref:tyrosine-type recombinase/integrase n=1 Tax=Clostridium felsineum TaxID=36839 RepID=UPI00214DE684
MRKKILTTESSLKTLDNCFDEFVLSMKVRNLRPSTIKFYKDYFHIFTMFMDSETPVNTITKNTIDDYILWLKGRKTEKDSTININLNAIRVFFNYCMDLGYMGKFKINKIKADKEIIDVYTDFELNLLLKKPNVKKVTFKVYSTWVIESTLMATGMRASTLINLKVKDVDLEEDLIMYRHTKNRRQVVIPLSLALKQILIEYLKYRKPKNEEDYLFCNSYGLFLKRDQLSHNIADYNRSRGVIKTGVHKFRHT